MSLVEIYKALSDESRMRIVNILSRGYFNVQELTTILHLSQSTISHHLKTLQSASIAKSHKEGTWAYYTLCTSQESTLPFRVTQELVKVIESPSLNGDAETFQRDIAALTAMLHSRRDQGQKFFDSVAGRWKQLRDEAQPEVQGDVPYLEKVAECIPHSAHLLEVGCGTGALLERILPRSGITIGVDYSQAMLDEARKNLCARASGVDLRLGYLEHLPLADSSIEIGVGCMVFHHLATPKDALKDLFRCLRPGGSLIIVDLVNHTNEYMRERFADLWMGFEPKEFESWLIDVGFKEVTTSKIGEKKEVFMVQARK